MISWEAVKLSPGAAEGKKERLSILSSSYTRLQLSAELLYSAPRDRREQLLPLATKPAPLCC